MSASQELSVTPGAEEDSAGTVDVSALLDYINFNSLKNYQFQIQSLENQIANLESQQDDSEKSL
ncbi:MAG: hypothetical protein WC364_12670 [Eubacteriales bacterium]|jgi:hypothetical protein